MLQLIKKLSQFERTDYTFLHVNNYRLVNISRVIYY